MLLLMPQEMVSKAGLAACSRRLQQHLQDARVAHTVGVQATLNLYP